MDPFYVAGYGVAFIIGWAIGRRRFAALGLVAVWLLAAAIIALAGGFAETAEDTSAGLVMFYVIDTGKWLICGLLGVVSRRAFERFRRRRVVAS